MISDSVACILAIEPDYISPDFITFLRHQIAQNENQ